MKDKYVIIALILFSVIVRMPVMDYPPAGDHVTYAKLSESLAVFSYEENNEPHKKYPPLFPATIIPFYFITGNSILSARLVNILFSSLAIGLTYIFLRRFKVKKLLSSILSLAVLFNPWFFNFTSVFGFSEGLAVFLLTFGFYYLYLYMHKQASIIPSAVLLGLASITRSSIVAVLSVCYLYFVYVFLKKRQWKDGAIFFFVSILPFVLWTIRNFLIPTPDGYIEYFCSSIIAYPHGLIYFIIIVFPLSFLAMTYFIIRAAIQWKKNTFFVIVTGSIIFHTALSVLAWDLVNHVGLISNPWSLDITINFNPLLNAIFAVRYFVVFIPIATVISGYYLKNFKRYRFVQQAAFAYLMVLFVLTVGYNFGFVQNQIGEYVSLPPTFVQRSDNNLQIVQWISDNDPQAYYRIDFIHTDRFTDYEETLRYNIRNAGFNIVETSADYIISDVAKPRNVFETRGHTKYYILKSSET